MQLVGQPAGLVLPPPVLRLEPHALLHELQLDARVALPAVVVVVVLELLLLLLNVVVVAMLLRAVVLALRLVPRLVPLVLALGAG